MHRLVPALLGATVCSLSLAAAVPTAAQAATAWPSKPTGVHIAHVSHSAFTVALQRSTNARSYALYVSTVKSDLFYDNLTANRASSARRVFRATAPSVAATNLPYRLTPYYYRVAAVNGTRSDFDGLIRSTGLRPTTPTNLVAVRAGNAASLQWATQSVTGFRVTWATDADLTQNVHSVSVRNSTPQFTPPSLVPGRTYYAAVRGINQSVGSGYSSVVRFTTAAHQQAVKVASYNILTLTYDGTREAGGTVPYWSQRGPAAAALLKGVGADVIGIQEGLAWVGSQPGVRQVDSLRNDLAAIGANYILARTEIPYPERGWRRTGNYILYNPAEYRTAGAGGHWDIGGTQSAVYQPLANVHTGARLLFVTTHLLQTPGASNDRVRESETETMLRLANDKAAALGMPAVYVGDFNSNPYQPVVDGPGIAMRAWRVADARAVASSVYRGDYDSWNGYRRTPYRYNLFLDYVWAPPGVTATSWGQALNMSGSQFAGTIPSDHNPVYATLLFPY